MITLLKGLDCYNPRHLGKSDILIVESRIGKIRPAGVWKSNPLIDSVMDCEGLKAFPGFIDQHVHIIGGGGEQGFPSRLGDIGTHEVLQAGVTTLVGLLGTDDRTKSLEALYAKAKSLEYDGLTTFLYTGSYSVPAVTFTKSIADDLILIDKVIGTGEISLSDHRSSHPGLNALHALARETHLGGLLSGKAGVVHFHIGDGKLGLAPLIQLVDQSDLPVEMFVPSHVNRSPRLFAQAEHYWKNGGNIDLTAGETAGFSLPDAMRKLLDSGLALERVTASSDSNGSIPGGGSSKIENLYRDIADCIVRKRIDPQTAVRPVTENAAKLLKLYPRKGTLREGSDADILITDKNYQINKLFCMGKLMMDHGKILKDAIPS